jgi:uncharacterized protein (DUF58 family)
MAVGKADWKKVMIVALFLLQAAAAPPPDIELNVHATARSVEIESKGKTELIVHAGPDAGSKVETRVTPRAEGAAKLNNVEVNIRAEARLTDPQQNPDEVETSRPD